MSALRMAFNFSMSLPRRSASRSSRLEPGGIVGRAHQIPKRAKHIFGGLTMHEVFAGIGLNKRAQCDRIGDTHI